MLEHADAHLVQVLEEAVEDRHEVARRVLLPDDHRQLVDGKGKSPPHLPLKLQFDAFSETKQKQKSSFSLRKQNTSTFSHKFAGCIYCRPTQVSTCNTRQLTCMSAARVSYSCLRHGQYFLPNVYATAGKL